MLTQNRGFFMEENISERKFNSADRFPYRRQRGYFLFRFYRRRALDLRFFRFPFVRISTFPKTRSLGTHRIRCSMFTYRSHGRKPFRRPFLIARAFFSRRRLITPNSRNRRLRPFSDVFRCRGARIRIVRTF